MPPKLCEIINGPSKFDLMVSLFDGENICPHKVTFEFKDFWAVKHIRKVRINSVERDKGFENWKIKGTLVGTLVEEPEREVHGEYSTRLRTGHFTHDGDYFSEGR